MAKKQSRKSIYNMNAGEWSDKLDGRIDLEKYNAAGRRVEDFLLRPQGVLERRPGTVYTHRTRGNADSRLEPFQFDQTDGYVIEIGAGYFRFNTNQARVMGTALAVSTASFIAAGGPGGEDIGRYTIPTSHVLQVGDLTTITGITPAGYNVTNGKVLARTAATIDIELPADPGAYSSGGTVQQPLEISNSYLAADIFDLDIRQINDVMVICHEDYAPARLIREASSPDTWIFEDIPFDQPAFRPTNVSDITMYPSATTGTGITITATAPNWAINTFYKANTMRYDSVGTFKIYRAKQDHISDGTAMSNDLSTYWEEQQIFNSGNVGGYVRIGHRRDAVKVTKRLWDQSSPGTTQNGSSGYITILGGWTLTTSGVWSGTVKVERRDAVTGNVETIYDGASEDGGRNISIAGNEDATTELRITMSDWANPTTGGAEDAYAYLEASDAYVYGYAKIATAADATYKTCTADVIDDFEAATSANDSDVWAEGSWSTRRGFPRTSALHEQRLIFAGNISEPLTIWGSVIGDFFNFDYGEAEDDRAFSYTIPADQQDPIEWAIGGKSILIGTGREYGILGSGSDDLTITPSNVNWRVQESVGYAGIRPLRVGPILVGVERNGKKLREIAYQFDAGIAGGYVANDLNRLNDDITESGIRQISFAQLREPYIYCVLNRGDMGVLAYNRQDGIVGWSKFQTSGDYTSVATIRGTDNDETWIVRKDGSERFIEYFQPTVWTDINNAWYVDSGVSYVGGPTSTFTGLEHLEGKTVVVLGDGSPRTVTTVVTDGSITIEGGDVQTAIIGLNFTSTFQPMRLDLDGAVGNSQGDRKQIFRTHVRVYKSVGFSIFNGNESRTVPFNNTNDFMGNAIQPFTGEKRVNWPTTYGSTSILTDASNNDPEVVISQVQPLPLTIVAIILHYNIIV